MNGLPLIRWFVGHNDTPIASCLERLFHINRFDWATSQTWFCCASICIVFFFRFNLRTNLTRQLTSLVLKGAIMLISAGTTAEIRNTKVLRIIAPLLRLLWQLLEAEFFENLVSGRWARRSARLFSNYSLRRMVGEQYWVDHAAKQRNIEPSLNASSVDVIKSK